MPVSFLSPSRYVSGAGAVREVGAAVARLGSRAAVVGGAKGLGAVADVLRPSLESARVPAVWLEHTGPCSVVAVERIAAAAKGEGCDVLVGVGGGRALDVTKGAAEALRVPYVLVPTSPATCAATTAVIVEYSVEGVYQRSRLVAEPAAYAFFDPDVVAAAPDRLLAAGLVDALAKAVEVRYAGGRVVRPSAGLTAALELCGAMLTTLHGDAFAGSPAAGYAPVADAGVDAAAHRAASRRELAELAVLWPGLIGALASEEAKLAAAHAVYNALTLLPGSRTYLHGELMTIGILTQFVLEGQGAQALERAADLFARLGCPLGLERLGCQAYLQDADARNAVLARAVELPSMRASFPDVRPARLHEAILAADAAARSGRLNPL